MTTKSEVYKCKVCGAIVAVVNGGKGVRRKYCYYTQFAPCVASLLPAPEDAHKLLTPLVDYLYNAFFTKMQLHRMLNTHAHQIQKVRPAS